MNEFYHVQRRRNILSFFSISFIFVAINILIFFSFMILSLLFFRNNPGILYDYIAIKPSNILAGNYLWTFLTSIFMHAGFFHLFANILSLIFIGSLVEKILGRKRFFWFYILSGIFAGLVFVLSSLFFIQDMNSFAVGASGSLFAIVGLLMLLTPNLPVYAMFIPIPIKMKYAGPGMLVVLWLISIAGNIPIGNTAHFGGLIVGLFYGAYLRVKYKKKTKYLRNYFS